MPTLKDQSAELAGGARIALRICAVDFHYEHTVTFSRLGKALGDVELVTFQKHCDVPADAIRYPEAGTQGEKRIAFHDRVIIRHYVAFRWYEPISHHQGDAQP